MKTDTTQTTVESVKIPCTTSSRQGRRSVPVRYIEDESLINAFLRRQSTIIVDSKADRLIALARSILREKSGAVVGNSTRDIGVSKNGSSVLEKNANLLRCMQKSERIIVSTEKQRSVAVHMFVALMKVFKRIHELADKGIFLSKRALVFRYGFLLGNTVFAMLARKTILFSLDFCAFSSEFARIVSLKAQRALLKRNYYYKECIFSDDMLHTIAHELSKEIELGRLECKVQIIQDYLKISYRQAYKIYGLLKQEAIA